MREGCKEISAAEKKGGKKRQKYEKVPGEMVQRDNVMGIFGDSVRVIHTLSST